MKFKHHLIADLPPLSWCARVNQGQQDVLLLHGASVETTPEAFVEGAWDDAFASLNFMDATVLCGTGGRRL